MDSTNYRKRVNIYNKLPLFTKKYISSTKSFDGSTELEKQLGVNFIPLHQNPIRKNLMGISTSVINLDDDELFALPIIVYNSKLWRQTFDNLIGQCICKIKYATKEKNGEYTIDLNKHDYDDIDIIEIYNSTIYNTCLLYLKNGDSKLINIICYLVRTLIFLTIGFRSKITSQQKRKIYKNKIKTLLLKNIDINQYKNSMHPCDWYWCLYSLLLEGEDLTEFVNLWDIILGMITQPLIGKGCFSLDIIEKNLLQIIFNHGLQYLPKINIKNVYDKDILVKNLHENSGHQFEEHFVKNAFVIEFVRCIFLNPYMARLCYGDFVCIDIIIKYVSYIRTIYTNLHGLSTLCIGISPNLYNQISNNNIAKIIALKINNDQNNTIYQNHQKIELFDIDNNSDNNNDNNNYNNNNNNNDNNNGCDNDYLDNIVKDNILFKRNSQKILAKLCNHKPLIEYFTKPFVRNVHESGNRNKFITHLLPYILDGNKIDIVKELIDNAIVCGIMGEKRLLQLICKFSPEKCRIRGYFEDKLPKIHPLQYHIHPKWLIKLIRKNTYLSEIIPYCDNNLQKKISFTSQKNAINTIAEFQEQLWYLSLYLNKTCIFCSKVSKNLINFHHQHRVCKKCYKNLNGNCPFCLH